MERYFKRKRVVEECRTSCDANDTEFEQVSVDKKVDDLPDIDDLPADPGLRRKIFEYHPNDQDKVHLFCEKNNLAIPNMTEIFTMRGRPRRNMQTATNLHHYQVDLFYSVIDTQLQELNNRFDEINSELFLCVACLNSCDSFSAFNKQQLMCMTKFYPSEFSEVDLIILDNQLENFIVDMKFSDAFLNLKGIGELAQKLVETKKHDIYHLVFLLIKLALILPIATATVERAFSAMKIIKSRLRNCMGDSWMNDCLLTYIEKDIFNSVDNEAIIQRFQNMKTRREKL